MKIVRHLLFCAPLLIAGCAPSYIPAPVVDLAPAPSEETAAPPETAIVAPPEAPPAPPPIPDGPRPQFYTVKSGDTLAAIGLNFGLSHRDIALWNGISNPDIVQVGQRLRLSPPPSSPVATAIGGDGAGAPDLSASLSETAEVAAAKAPGLTESPPLESPTETATVDSAGRNVLRPQSTIAGESVEVGGATSDGEAGVDGGGRGFVKTGPLAESFAYSAAKLQALRAEWDARGSEGEEERESSTDAAADAAAVGGGGSGGSGGSGGIEAERPGSTRRAFGVDWSWPALGDLLSGFSDSSRGWDIGGADGDPVYAAADGKVIYAGSGIKGFGRLVIVKHTNDYLSAYAHNRRILKKEGAQVRRGEVIAEMGDSGAERTKLHFQIRKAGRPTDPAEFLPERP